MLNVMISVIISTFKKKKKKSDSYEITAFTITFSCINHAKFFIHPLKRNQILVIIIILSKI